MVFWSSMMVREVLGFGMPVKIFGGLFYVLFLSDVLVLKYC